MFTGLITHCLPILRSTRAGTGLCIETANPWHAAGPDQVVAGESIAVSGCCLTAVGPIHSSLVFDLSEETLSRTWFGAAQVGRLLNFERSVRLSDRLGGHLVSGHVDGTGRIAEITDVGDGGRVFSFRAPDNFGRYLIEKGSVTIDGISLTVVAPEQGCFKVAVIPTTLAETSLGRARVGDLVHLEADMIGKWIERLLLRQHP